MEVDLKVVLDSTALKATRPDSKAMEELRALCAAGAVELLVPELVLWESATGLVEDARKHWSKAQRPNSLLAG